MPVMMSTKNLKKTIILSAPAVGANVVTMSVLPTGYTDTVDEQKAAVETENPAAVAAAENPAAENTKHEATARAASAAAASVRNPLFMSVPAMKNQDGTTMKNADGTDFRPLVDANGNPISGNVPDWAGPSVAGRGAMAI